MIERDDRELHDALHALPAPVAPSTLLTRVMQDVADLDAQRVPARPGLAPWFTWSVRSQVVAFALLLVVGGALARWAPVARAWWHSLQATAPVAVSRVIWDALGPAITGGSIYVVVMGVVVACVTAALSHVVIDSSQRQM